MKTRLLFALPKPPNRRESPSGAETSGGPCHSLVTPGQGVSRVDIRVVQSLSDCTLRSVSPLCRLRPDVSGPPSLTLWVSPPALPVSVIQKGRGPGLPLGKVDSKSGLVERDQGASSCRGNTLDCRSTLAHRKLPAWATSRRPIQVYEGAVGDPCECDPSDHPDTQSKTGQTARTS